MLAITLTAAFELVECTSESYKTDLLKRAGEVAALSFRPSDEGFIVKTTWRLHITYKIKDVDDYTAIQKIIEGEEYMHMQSWTTLKHLGHL